MVEEGFTDFDPDNETEPMDEILTEVARLVDQRKGVESPRGIGVF